MSQLRGCPDYGRSWPQMELALLMLSLRTLTQLMVFVGPNAEPIVYSLEV